MLTWYDRNARDLPWRRKPGDGYSQWVAEIMLQQTQVATVIPYFERFMESFPDVRALAAASDDDLLHHWQGLGYYRRASNLRKSARKLAEPHTEFPSDPVELRNLPGIGRYTAGAIASIAFNRRAAAVDGNIARVYSRIFKITECVSDATTQQQLWDLAELLIPRNRPGDYNQSLMDLGATVCVPRTPRCGSCPVAGECRAFVDNDIDPGDLPVKSRRIAVPERQVVATLLEIRGRFLFRKRPDEGLWSGLWEIPNVEIGRGESPLTAIDAILENCGLALQAASTPLLKGPIQHQLTHRRLTFHVYHVHCQKIGAVRTDKTLRWLPRSRFGGIPASTATRKMLALISSTKSASPM
jgi:A/G-specific adenine glycosylase